MDLIQLRTAYHTGNYQKIAIASTNLSSSSSSGGGSIAGGSEAVVLTWKAVMRASNGDVSKCAPILNNTNVSELLKKALMLWSKALKSSLTGATSAADSKAFKDLGLQAHESSDLSSEERDQIVITAAEGCLLSCSSEDAFSLLKLLKASNLDSQVMFVGMLVEVGQLNSANQRLEKMKNIPEWKDDIRFLLTEALLGIYNQSSNNTNDQQQEQKVNSSSSPSPYSSFTPMDSLYSYQELIQVHGDSCKLQLLLSAAYAALGKFSEAHSSLLQIRDSNVFDEPVLKANLIVTSAFILDSNQFTPALNCSVACCKLHKESNCIPSESSNNNNYDNSEKYNFDSSPPPPPPPPINNSGFADRLKSNSTIKSFLDSHPYLQIQLPILLARLDRSSDSSSASNNSELAKDLEKKERISRLLKETIETDPQVAELFELLQQEHFI